MTNSLTNPRAIRIVTGCDKRHEFAVGALLVNLIRTQTSNFEFCVYVEASSSPQFEETLRKLHGDAKVIRVDQSKYSNTLLRAPSIQHFTPMVLSKIECLSLLEDGVDLVWLDYDLVVKSDLGELVSELGIHKFAFPRAGILAEQFLQAPPQIELHAPAYATGTFVIRGNPFQSENVVKKGLGIAEAWATLLYLPDQAVLSQLLNHSGEDVRILEDEVWVCHPLEKDSQGAKILHSYGKKKFWNGIPDESWRLNYIFWVKSGGVAQKRTFQLKGPMSLLRGALRAWKRRKYISGVVREF